MKSRSELIKERKIKVKHINNIHVIRAITDFNETKLLFVIFLEKDLIL